VVTTKCDSWTNDHSNWSKLAPVAVGQITTIKVNGIDTATDWRYYVVALVTFLTIVIVAVKAKGFLKIIPFLIGIVAGYLMSLAVGLVDFEIFKDITFSQYQNSNLYFNINQTLVPL